MTVAGQVLAIIILSDNEIMMPLPMPMPDAGCGPVLVTGPRTRRVCRLSRNEPPTHRSRSPSTNPQPGLALNLTCTPARTCLLAQSTEPPAGMTYARLQWLSHEPPANHQPRHTDTDVHHTRRPRRACRNNAQRTTRGTPASTSAWRSGGSGSAARHTPNTELRAAG